MFMNKRLFMVSLAMLLVGDGALLAARFLGKVVPSDAIMSVAIVIAALVAFGGVGAVLFGTLWVCSTPKEKSKKGTLSHLARVAWKEFQEAEARAELERYR
jgi:hypothetical protein